MKEMLSKVMAHHAKNLPFAIYCAPKNAVVKAYLQSSNDLHEIKDFGESGFAFCSFDNSRQYYIPENSSEVLSESKDTIDSKLSLKAYDVTDDGKNDFEILVQKAIAEIESGDALKIVVSRKEIFRLKQFDLEKSFGRLVANYPDAFCYCFCHPKVGLWLGATPERLLKVDGLNFETVALAGTQSNAGLDGVIWNEKEIDEQRFVSDFIEENLRSFTTTLDVSKPYTSWAGKLAHIKTDFSGLLKADEDLKKILQSLHPTPAVCGLPKSAAKKFISENEGYDRSFYSGFLGLLNTNNKTDLYVNLRCMEILDGQANIFVGCGVTKDSSPEKEFLETAHKALTMKSVL